MAGNLFDFMVEQNTRDALREFGQKQFGSSNPTLAALAQADPEAFRSILPDIIKHQMEGQAIQQFYGGGQQQTQQPQGQSADSILAGYSPTQEQAEQSAQNAGITWNAPQGQPMDADTVLSQMAQLQEPQPRPMQQSTQNNDAISKYAAMAYLPGPLQTAAAQQMMFSGMGFGNTGGNGPVSSDVHGDAFLSTLAPPIASQVKGLAEGKIPFPSSFALKSPYWQQMISAVSQYDPEFDAVNYQARAQTRKDFTAGKSAQSINALNTVAEHVGALKKLGDALESGNIPALNWVSSGVKSATGDPSVNSYDLAAGHVAEELTRAWRGSGGSEADIERSLGTLGHNMSPVQRSSALATIGDLIKGKIDALGDQYKRGMGTAAQDTNFYSPQATDAFKTIGLDLGGDNYSEGAISKASSQQPSFTEGQIVRNKKTGQVAKVVNGQLVPVQ